MNTNVANPEQVFAFGGRVVTRTNSLDLSQDRVNALNGGSNPDPKFWTEFDLIAQGSYAKPIIVPDKTILALGDWQSFCQRVLKVKLDLSNLRIPSPVDGLERLIITPAGISIDLVVKIHKDRKIPFWKGFSESLESVMQESERGLVKQTSAIWVRDGQEADDDLQNFSAEMIVAQKIDTERPLERLVHGLKYHDETGEYLDINTVTLCAGSRYSDGDVLCVCRHGAGYVRVAGCAPQAHNPGLRARRAAR